MSLTDEQIKARRAKWQREWRAKNPEKHKAGAKKRNEISIKWNKENPDKHRKSHNKWVDNNRDTVNRLNKESRERNKEIFLKRKRERQKEIFDNNPIIRMGHNIRCLINSSFKRGKRGFKKSNKTEEIIGCSIEFLVNYILSLCPEGVGIEDFSKFGYHIDHIIPLSRAKTKEDIVRFNHYTNLQPLFYLDNLRKSKK